MTIHRTGHRPPHTTCHLLPIALRHPLQFILLFDGIRVRASLGSIDQFFSQALSYALDVSESSLSRTNGQECDGLVNTAERRDIDSLATDGTGRANSSAVFPGTAVDDGVNGDLDRVLVGHYVDLQIYNEISQIS